MQPYELLKHVRSQLIKLSSNPILKRAWTEDPEILQRYKDINNAMAKLVKLGSKTFEQPPEPKAEPTPEPLPEPVTPEPTEPTKPEAVPVYKNYTSVPLPDMISFNQSGTGELVLHYETQSTPADNEDIKASRTNQVKRFLMDLSNNGKQHVPVVAWKEFLANYSWSSVPMLELIAEELEVELEDEIDQELFIKCTRSDLYTYYLKLQTRGTDHISFKVGGNGNSKHLTIRNESTKMEINCPVVDTNAVGAAKLVTTPKGLGWLLAAKRTEFITLRWVPESEESLITVDLDNESMKISRE